MIKKFRYLSTCATGFTGLLCDQPIQDSCLATPCNTHGTCMLNETGQYSCKCETSGYEGKLCETDKCFPSCNRGVCFENDAGIYSCNCYKGFKGESCSESETS